MTKLRRFARDNGLSLVVFGLFSVFLACESVAGLLAYNSEREEHGLPTVGYAQFVASGRFVEATTENWESEFLEMAFYVTLTAFLYQRGSAESKSPAGDEAADRDPRQTSDPVRAPWPVRRGGWVLRIYENSLSLALFLLFFAAFLVHAVNGMRDFNVEQLEHGKPEVTLGEFLCSSQFWFQSFQNWQSEFLGLGTMIVLSIYLRQRGSPESKPVDAPHFQTGNK